MRSQRRRGWQKGSEQGFDEDESADQSFFCAPLTRIIGRHCAPTPANYQSFLTCAATAPQLRPSETRTAPKLRPHLGRGHAPLCPETAPQLRPSETRTAPQLRPSETRTAPQLRP